MLLKHFKKHFKKYMGTVGILLWAGLAQPVSADPMTVTWYGAEYPASNTANGETFDRWGYTAAHSHWTFGTWVQVTNPSNGKSVIVRINDRAAVGFLDISEQAAIDLGIKVQGIATLEVKLLQPDEFAESDFQQPSPGVKSAAPPKGNASSDHPEVMAD